MSLRKRKGTGSVKDPEWSGGKGVIVRGAGWVAEALYEPPLMGVAGAGELGESGYIHSATSANEIFR